MTRTKKREKKQPNMEAKFEAEMEQQRRQKAAAQLPPQVMQAKTELETALNAQVTKARTRPVTLQAPPTDSPEAGLGGSVLWWTGVMLDQYIPLSEYADPKRQGDLQAFALIAPLALNASATMIKKAQALQ